MRTDAALRELLRIGRRQARLSQEEAARRADVSRSWWKRVENATEVSVTDDTLLDMLQAVGIRPVHLARIGHSELAELLGKRETFAADEAPGDLQEYLANAPASAAMRQALMITAKTLSEIREGVNTDPFADLFPSGKRRKRDGQTRDE